MKNDNIIKLVYKNTSFTKEFYRLIISIEYRNKRVDFYELYS